MADSWRIRGGLMAGLWRRLVNKIDVVLLGQPRVMKQTRFVQAVQGTYLGLDGLCQQCHN